MEKIFRHLLILCLLISAVSAGAASRPETSINHLYTAVIASADSPRTVFATVNNTADESRQMTAFVSGAGTTFGNGETSLDFQLSPAESRRFRLEIKPEEAGKKNLRFTVQDDLLRINSSDSIKVYARKGGSVSVRDVPGIGSIQVIFLLAAATLLYSSRL